MKNHSSCFTLLFGIDEMRSTEGKDNRKCGANL